MATIISEHTTCDGHNVTCLFGDQRLTLHFPNVPSLAEKTEMIATTESRLLDEAIAANAITEFGGGEDGLFG